MMLVPKRLQKNFELTQEKPGDYITVKGVLSCCNQNHFSISYLGELKTTFLGHKYIVPESGAVLWAKCKTCGKEIMVFNGKTDGYDYSVSENADLSLTLSGHAAFSCSKCSNDFFSVCLEFQYLDKEEYIKEGIHEYENAFLWIWLTLTCSSCKKTFKNFFDMETC